MKIGDLVKNKNSESGELGIFMGTRSKKYIAVVHPNAKNYTYAEVYWPERQYVGTIQTNLIEVINED